MKKIILTSFLSALTAVIWAQKEDYIWLGGIEHMIPNGTIQDSSFLLDFHTEPPTFRLVRRNMAESPSRASICDSQGNLLFYANGCQIHDASFQLMLNGDNLNWGYWYQDACPHSYLALYGMLWVPHPTDSNIYYLLHQYVVDFPIPPYVELRYSKIDKSLNGGLGAVVEKNIVIEDSLAFGKLEAVRHENGKDWWITAFMHDEPAFCRILLDEQGFHICKQYINGLPNGGLLGGQAAFSPDGTKFAHHVCGQGLFLFDFDRCSGLFDLVSMFPFCDSTDTRTVAFSPNSRFLYVNDHWRLHQFDTWAINLEASRIQVGEYDDFRDTLSPSLTPTAFSDMLLAPNNKIYMPANGSHFLHVIEEPDSFGLACNFVQRGVLLPRRGSIFSSNFPLFLPAGTCVPEPFCEERVGTAAAESLPGAAVLLRPNPAHSRSEIVFERDVAGSLECFDLNGSLLFRQNFPAASVWEFSVERLEPGLYFCRILTPEGSRTLRLTVLRF